MSDTLQLVPIGGTARELVAEIADLVRSELGFEVVLGAPMAHPKFAFNKDRNQYHSQAILRRLAASRPPDHASIAGVTEVDLFLPDAPFVFGEADRRSRAALLSLARLRPEFEGRRPNNDQLRARARVELAHEVGHLAGLSHCHDHRCLMFFASSVVETDRKLPELCHECKAELSRAATQR